MRIDEIAEVTERKRRKEELLEEFIRRRKA